MEFRIRKTDIDDDSEIERSHKAYFEHLGPFKKSSNSDLWKFFYWDFFHDGSIESINTSDCFKTVTMTIEAPNIKRLLPNGGFEFINATFICVFRNVVYFTMNNMSPEEWLSRHTERAIFLGAEINTFPGLAKLAGKDDFSEFYSLLIEILAGGVSVWLEMVFSQVDVHAQEEVAFAIMEADPKFEVPVYRPESQGKAQEIR